MNDLRWPNVTDLVVVHLAAQLGASVKGVSEDRPRDLKVLTPYVIVTRGPGSDDGITDLPAVDVETYATSRSVMWAIAEDVRDAIHRLAGAVVDTDAGPKLVDTVRTSVTAVYVPYSADVRRVVATYRLGLRKQPTGT